MYALIHNDQIEVGPRDWNVAMFKSFFVENELPDESDLIPRIAPTEIITGTNWRIVPVEIGFMPPCDPIFEQLVGPETTILPHKVLLTYSKTWQTIPIIKSHLLERVKDTRYNVENGGIVLTIDDVKILVPTDRESRNIILTGVPGKWKFKQISTIQMRRRGELTDVDMGNGYVWLTLSEYTLDLIVDSVRSHVQEAFNWEAQLTSEINLAQTIEELQAIDLTPIVKIPNA